MTNPELPAMTDALKTIRVAEEYGKNITGIIVTRSKKDAYDISLKNIEAMLEKPIIAVIPEDQCIRKSLASKNSIIFTHPSSPASKSYLQLAALLSGQQGSEDVKLNWIDKFFKIFKRQPQ